MLSTILLILSIVVILFLLLLIAPIRFYAKGFSDGRQHRFAAVLSWFPMAAIKLEYSSDGMKTKLVIFGFKRNLEMEPKKKKDGKESDDFPWHKKPASDHLKSAGKEASRSKTANDTYLGSERTTSDQGTETSSPVNKKKNEGPAIDSESEKNPGIFDTIFQSLGFRIVTNGYLRSRLIKWTKRLLFGLFRSVSAAVIDVQVEAGLEDFAQTGKIAGYVSAVKNALQVGTKRPVLFGFTPVFDRQSMQVDGVVDCRSSLVRILWPVVVGVGSFPYWSMMREMRRKPLKVVPSDDAR